MLDVLLKVLDVLLDVLLDASMDALDAMDALMGVVCVGVSVDGCGKCGCLKGVLRFRSKQRASKQTTRLEANSETHVKASQLGVGL